MFTFVQMFNPKQMYNAMTTNSSNQLTKEQKHERFNSWWQYVPNKDVSEIRERVMKHCFISRMTFYNWENGITEIPQLAIPFIENIAGKEIFSINDLKV